jgi:hypothetical protein
MSRFNATGTFIYDTNAAGTVTVGAGGTYLYLGPGQMPQYPFKTFVVEDTTAYRSKGGTLWTYSNYCKRGLEFNWSMLDEVTRSSLWGMYMLTPTFVFNSGTNYFGTFRFEPNSIEEEEVVFSLFDMSFTATPV